MSSHRVIALVALVATVSTVPLDTKQRRSPSIVAQRTEPRNSSACELDGEIYQEETRIIDFTDPCSIKFCIKGGIRTSRLQCRLRSDCSGRRVEGHCCPSYTHCQEEDASTETRWADPEDLSELEVSTSTSVKTVARTFSVRTDVNSILTKLDAELRAHIQQTDPKYERIERETTAFQAADDLQPQADSSRIRVAKRRKVIMLGSRSLSEEPKAVKKTIGSPQHEDGPTTDNETRGRSVFRPSIQEVEANIPPTVVPQNVEVATSLSVEMSQVISSVSVRSGEPFHAPKYAQKEVSTERDGTTTTTTTTEAPDISSSTESQLEQEEENAAEDELVEDEDSISVDAGTLIFYLGENSPEEIDQLVQDNVLGAIAQSIGEEFSDVLQNKPTIEVEGSNTSYEDGRNSVDGSGEEPTQYVSIHF